MARSSPKSDARSSPKASPKSENGTGKEHNSPPPAKPTNNGMSNGTDTAASRPWYATRRVTLLVGIAAGLLLPYVLQKSRLVHHDAVPEAVKDAVLRPLDSMAAVLSEYMEDMRKMELSFDFESGPRRFWEQMVPEMDFRPLFSSPTRPGLRLREEGLKPYHPVVMVPGFITSGLEIWQGEKCLQQYFRQRIWGTTGMLRSFMSDQACWLRHMATDPKSGMDPPGIRLRAAQGLGAADYVIGAYWVWAQVIENLADIGYTSSDMHLASYDWRMAPPLLEKRDRFMTRLANTIELAVQISGRPVVIVGHSYGNQVVKYFLNWVESANGAGKASAEMGVGRKMWSGSHQRGWVKKHVAGFVNIAGPMFGVPPSVSSLLSGEMRETADLGAMSTALDYYLPPYSRVKLFRTWSSLVSMMPMGGEAVWGNLTYAPDDIAEEEGGEPGEEADAAANADAIAETEAAEKNCRAAASGKGGENGTDSGSSCDPPEKKKASLGSIISFAPGIVGVRGNTTAMDAWEELLKPRQTLEGVEDINDVSGVAKRGTNLRSAKWDHSRYWTNPLTSALPDAPNLKIYCLYGVGQKTERAYLYKRAPPSMRYDASAQAAAESEVTNGETEGGSEGEGGECPVTAEPPAALSASAAAEAAEDIRAAAEEQGSAATAGGEGGKDSSEEGGNGSGSSSGVDLSFEAEELVPYMVDNAARGGFQNGLRMAQGDGTVPLISLGYMCSKGWTDPRLPYNPSRVEVIAKEFPHKPTGLLPRGGGTSSNHIDIMGNVELLEDLLNIAAGRGSTVEGRILSGIRTVAERVIID